MPRLLAATGSSEPTGRARLALVLGVSSAIRQCPDSPLYSPSFAEIAFDYAHKARKVEDASEKAIHANYITARSRRNTKRANFPVGKAIIPTFRRTPSLSLFVVIAELCRCAGCDRAGKRIAHRTYGVAKILPRGFQAFRPSLSFLSHRATCDLRQTLERALCAAYFSCCLVEVAQVPTPLSLEGIQILFFDLCRQLPPF